MKNILVAAVFLFSQLGITAEKINETKTKKFQIEDLTFSQLFLTQEEIIHLNEEDRAKYLFGMIALGQIFEGSQRFHMGYEDTVIKTSALEKSDEKIAPKTSGKYANYFKILIPAANAWAMLVARVAAMLTPALEAAASWVAERGAAVIATKEAAKRAVVAVGESRMAQDTVKEGFRVALTLDKAGLEAASKSAVANAKKLKSAEEAVMKAAKKSDMKAVEKAQLEYAGIRDGALASDRAAFIKAKGLAEKDAAGLDAANKEFDKLLKQSKISSIYTWTKNNVGKMAVGTLAYMQVDSMAKDKFGTSVSEATVAGATSVWDYLKQKAVSVYDYFAGTDMSGPAITSQKVVITEKMKAGDSRQVVDKVCLFGGTPSLWQQQGAVINCHRPDSAENANCKKDDGKFQCPTYGITLVNAPIDASLCIRTTPLDDLTVRCGNTLKTVLEVKQAELKSTEEAQALQKNYGDVVKALEDTSRMKNDKGETKSILEYCAADSVTQKEECAKIKEVLALFKSTDIVKIYEGRRSVAAAKPAPAAGAPAAGNVEKTQ